MVTPWSPTSVEHWNSWPEDLVLDGLDEILMVSGPDSDLYGLLTSDHELLSEAAEILGFEPAAAIVHEGHGALKVLWFQSAEIAGDLWREIREALSASHS